MKKLAFLMTLSLIFIYGCSEEAQITDVSGENITQENLKGPGEGNGIMHHASAGGNDACEAFGLPPGCDGNYSLVANMHADGSVSGQMIDTFGGGEGIHYTIDCFKQVDNWAIVGGFDSDTGIRYVNAIVDNGTSNNDLNDQISFTVEFGGDCMELDISDFEAINYLFDLTKGQVKVW